MLIDVFRLASPTLAILSSLLLVSGLMACHGNSAAGTPDSQASAAARQRQLNDQVRAELQAIPPPTKSKFASIRSLDGWRNPYLTVQDNLLVLHVTVADANASDLGEGGMLRPIGARQQTLTIATAELPAALNAIPPNAWPYGRVIAVEEAHNAPKNVEPQLRRTLEGVMHTLSDLGVVVYEWTENGPEIR